MLDQAGIKAILPHRFPMLLVDAVREIEEGARIVAIKAVTGSESCYARLPADASPRSYAYPPTLIIESFCQAAGVLSNRAQAVDPERTLMLFGSLSGFALHADVYPGQIMEHHVRIERSLSDAAVFSGEVRVDGTVVATAERIVVAIRPREGAAAPVVASPMLPAAV